MADVDEPEEEGTGWRRAPEVLTGSQKPPKRSRPSQSWPGERPPAAAEQRPGQEPETKKNMPPAPMPPAQQTTVRRTPVAPPEHVRRSEPPSRGGWPSATEQQRSIEWPTEGPKRPGSRSATPPPANAPQPQPSQPQVQRQPPQSPPPRAQPQGPRSQPPQPWPRPAPQPQPSQPQPSQLPQAPIAGQPQGGQWAQGMPVPPVTPKQESAPTPPDAPQPTSVLAEAPATKIVVAPKRDRPQEPELPPTQAAEPDSSSRPFPGTGSSSGLRRSTQSRASRGLLGAGLVEVPRVPYRDPASAVLTDPEVAENKRYCSKCGGKVGRSRNGEPARAEGQCANCGAAFSFKPKLRSGDLLGGQYEVLGCLAYGGLGWIYLAKDHNVSDRWVVLKGLIDTGDPTAMASAVAERRFLAEVEHPNIVKIYNFVQHPDPKTGNSIGYIVMEYVGGQSLRQIALEHHRSAGRAQPLPIGQVIAYGLEILGAMGYLHSVGLLYCDLKPDNVIQTHEQLKLIDLGAVRGMDDDESPLFFTSGYSAPELADEGASVASDICTVGRTLAVLSLEFTGYTTTYKHSLPGPEDAPLFALFGSYYRILRRATHPDPKRRFYTAEEMADQLKAVLREVMALGTSRTRPGVSTMFSPEVRTFGSDPNGSLTTPSPAEVVSAFPVPLVDTDDPAAGMLATATATEPAELIDTLAGAPKESPEVRLRLVRARVELGDLTRAAGELEVAGRVLEDQYDWRLTWHRGLIELSANRYAEARAAFAAVYDTLPGEAAPKLGLAISAEYQGDHFAAARFYELVWRTDHSFVSAAFGLARVYLAQGARASAIEVLEAVPDSSSHFVAAQVAAIKVKTRGQEIAKLADKDLYDAARKLERLTLDAERRTRLAADVLEVAYGWVRAGRPGATAGDGDQVLGCQLSERDLRFGLESCYRTLARLAGTAEERHHLVDRANSIRPRTLT